MACTALLLLLLSLAAACSAQPNDTAIERLPTVVGIAGFDDAPYWSETAPGSGNYTGFLAVILQGVCELAALDCSLQPIPAFKDMVPTLQSGAVDWVLGTLSVTPEREKQVAFVRPFFYSSGAALYAPPASHGALLGGWASLAGKPVCLLEGYYSAEALLAKFNFTPVYVPDSASGAAAVKAASCITYIDDAGYPKPELPQVAEVLATMPVFTAPYGIAVQQGDNALWTRISAALTRMSMDGANSTLLQAERQYLEAAGVPANPGLSELVNSISYFSATPPSLQLRRAR